MENSIAMDLDYIKLFTMESDGMLDEFRRLKRLGVSALVIPYEVFVNKELLYFKEALIDGLNKIKFKIYLSASNIRNFDTTYVDDNEFKDSITMHKQFVCNTYKYLEEHGLSDGMKVIFKGGICAEDNLMLYLDKTITFFREISNAVEKMNVDILLETLQLDLNQRRVGDRWLDFDLICKNISNQNFGLCWNFKNTRVNATEFGDSFIPGLEILKRVKLATLTNALEHTVTRKPFNIEMQVEEIKALLASGYDDGFHLEYIYSYIEKLGIPYTNVYDSIEYLRYILTYYKNLNSKGLIELNDDFDKMNRKYIRREFLDDTTVVVEKNDMRFDNVELSEQYVRIIGLDPMDIEVDEMTRLFIKVRNVMLDVECKLISKRIEDGVYIYIFRIENIDRKSRRSICEVLYLFE